MQSIKTAMHRDWPCASHCKQWKRGEVKKPARTHRGRRPHCLRNPPIAITLMHQVCQLQLLPRAEKTCKVAAENKEGIGEVMGVLAPVGAVGQGIGGEGKLPPKPSPLAYKAAPKLLELLTQPPKPPSPFSSFPIEQPTTVQSFKEA